MMSDDELARRQSSDLVEQPADSLAGPIAAWLDSKRRRSSSDRTIGAYSSTLNDARATLQGLGLDLDSEPRAVALALQGWAGQSKRPGKEPKPSTVAHRLAVVSSFYDFCVKRQLHPAITGNPAAMVERPQVESYAQAQALDPQQVQAVLRRLRTEAAAGQGETTPAPGPAAQRAARDLALLRVALTTGRRAAELAGLRWGDVQVIDSARGMVLTFSRAKGGKVMRDALAPSVAADVLSWLHRYYGAELGRLSNDAPLWPALGRWGKDSGPLSTQALGEVVERRLGAHAHQLRHTFAHGMNQLGAKTSEIQARLGHSDMSTTGRYLAELDKASNPYAGQLAELFDGQGSE